LPSEPHWLPLDEIIDLNRDLVADTHEPHSVIKFGELESACFRPLRHWEYDGERDVVVLAVRLLFGIARSHGFLQGNKRTGFLAALMFLGLNGWELDPQTDSQALGDLVIEVLNEGMAEDAFIALLVPHLRAT
jgi:death-on-curing protein